MIIADLHIHSRFSRATARDMIPERLWVAAQIKGIDLVGTGDFTHPGWLEELEEKLVPVGDGTYELVPELARAMAGQLPAACHRGVKFVLSGEISSIYSLGGRTRKVHSLILMPGIEEVRAFNERLGRIGNLASDGRPIVGLGARELLELCLEVSEQALFIPAHIWTPWFSLFGSRSGFDSIEECFGELTAHIPALETGLSSDPPMNWRCSALERFVLVSNSDAHSPSRLGREANLLDCAPTYPALAEAIRAGRQGGFVGTIEFYPEEGKYHLDGHRKCGVRLTPAQTRALGGRCPVCGGVVTVGVLSRVEELADRPEGYRPPAAQHYESLVPLPEVVGEVLGVGPGTKKVREVVGRLLGELGPELVVLREAALEDIARVGGELLAEAIRRVRKGKVWTEPGFDGQFGVVKVFAPGEREQLVGQGSLWHLGRAGTKASSTGQLLPKAPGPTQPQLKTDVASAKMGLDRHQQQAVEWDGGHLLLRAGPGAGKTRVIVERAGRLVQGGAEPRSLLLITFTRKAAQELATRLEPTPAAAARTSTFHALGLEIIAEAWTNPPRVLTEAERMELVAGLAKGLEMSPSALGLAITRARQRLVPPSELKDVLSRYEAELRAAGAIDMDGLVLEAVRALEGDEKIRKKWAGGLREILVDEYQDTNPVQVRLLKLLASGGARVVAIGDPDQAIYAFRGAVPALFGAFAQHFPGARVLGLPTNYRNSPQILSVAQAVIAPLSDPTRPPLEPRRPPGPLPVALHASSPEAEARWIARKIVGLVGGVDSRDVERGASGTLAPRDIAVVYRLHAMGPAIAAALEEAGVPCQVGSPEPLAETDPLDFKAQKVSLMSMHAAKGLEFEAVFVAGLEEPLVPYRPPGGAAPDLAEERRLVYVAITRAKSFLGLSGARGRRLFGRLSRGPSRFWADIPAQLIRLERPTPRRRHQQLSLW